MKTMWCGLAVAAAVFGAGCDIHANGSGPGVQGDGVTKTEARAVGAFHAIELDAPLRLELAPGPVAVSLAGDENLLPLITTTVSDGKLVVKTTREMRMSSLVVLTVHAPGVDRIEADGVAKVHATGIDVPHFAVNASGTCELTLAGKTDQLDVDVAGVANVHAADLVTKSARVGLSGTANVEIDATDKLQADVSGMGAVVYRGSPAVTKSISGMGTVKPMT